MRSDEAILTSSGPSVFTVWNPTELGFNGVSIAAGVGTAGTFVRVAGYRKLAVVINCNQPYSLYVFTKISGVQSTDSLFVNGSTTPITGAAATHRTMIVDCCYEEVAVYVKNTGSSSATVTCAMMAMA